MSQIGRPFFSIFLAFKYFDFLPRGFSFGGNFRKSPQVGGRAGPQKLQNGKHCVNQKNMRVQKPVSQIVCPIFGIIFWHLNTSIFCPVVLALLAIFVMAPPEGGLPETPKWEKLRQPK